MWRGGCIIRSRFLGKIKDAYDKNPKLANLLLDDYFRGEIKKSQKGWRNVVALAAKKADFWQDYKFVNPVSKKIEPKQMFCHPLADTAVCAGVYAQ